MRAHLIALLSIIALFACTSAAHIEDPYPNARSVRLFVESGWNEKTQKPIFTHPDGVSLSQGQRSRFEQSLEFVPTPDEMAACFVPHHFFRYYDGSGKQIGEVQVCFCCSGVSATRSDKLNAPTNRILEGDYDQIGKIVEELGESTTASCGGV